MKLVLIIFNALKLYCWLVPAVRIQEGKIFLNFSTVKTGDITGCFFGADFTDLSDLSKGFEVVEMLTYRQVFNGWKYKFKLGD